METLNIVIPTEIMAMIDAEAHKHNVSAETVASILLVSEVTHTLWGKSSVSAKE